MYPLGSFLTPSSYVRRYEGAVPSEGAELAGIHCSGIDFALHVKVHYGVKKVNTFYANETFLKLFQ